MTRENSDQIEETQGDELAGKYMCFKLGTEEYALDILRVQELIAVLEITRVPGTESFVRGVMNLRGTVIPVVDLRLKLGMEAVPATKNTVIVVVRFPYLDRTATIGALVDRVVGVTDLSGEQIDAVPELSSAAVKRDFIRAVAKVEGRVVFLLDVVQALMPTTDAVGLAQGAAA